MAAKPRDRRQTESSFDIMAALVAALTPAPRDATSDWIAPEPGETSARAAAGVAIGAFCAAMAVRAGFFILDRLFFAYYTVANALGSPLLLPREDSFDPDGSSFTLFYIVLNIARLLIIALALAAFVVGAAAVLSAASLPIPAPLQAMAAAVQRSGTLSKPQRRR